MCGIVGYIGKNKKAKEVLLDGLQRLEYRGYDSAGICVLEKGRARIWRAVGKVRELEKKITKTTGKTNIGIAHTRWATHGKPSVRNAHPHSSGKIHLVHNGIIENYQELKEKLRKRDINLALTQIVRWWLILLMSILKNTILRKQLVKLWGIFEEPML
jgi:glucosamine--fructose-6-phosphate aminotransferase (isomerizing)